MPVARKPVARPSASDAAAAPDEATIRAVIERGGTVAGEGGRPDEAVRKLLQLRLPTSLIDRIDGVRRAHVVPPSRHHWILEAIHEKLLREEGDADG
ncbi:MAG: hypothetical protein U0S49_13150 [Rhodospirillales bacterium]|nr:hypothetical protein [Rhodospirillales bacterium]